MYRGAKKYHIVLVGPVLLLHVEIAGCTEGITQKRYSTLVIQMSCLAQLLTVRTAADLISHYQRSKPQHHVQSNSNPNRLSSIIVSAILFLYTLQQLSSSSQFFVAIQAPLQEYSTLQDIINSYSPPFLRGAKPLSVVTLLFGR